MDLHTDIADITRLTTKHKDGLKRLGISTVQDLLYYFPQRYGDKQDLAYINELQVGDKSIIYAQVKSVRASTSYKQRRSMTEAKLQEPSGTTISAVWFSQPYISKMLSVGTMARFSGTVNERNGSLYLANPEFEKIKSIPIEKSGQLFTKGTPEHEHVLYPVYRETAGLTSKWIFHTIQKIFSNDMFGKIIDPIPAHILDAYKLPSIHDALIYMHAPRREADTVVARKRFAFEEIFFSQLVRLHERQLYEQSGSFCISPDNPRVDSFISSLPFTLTAGQQRSVQNIIQDMSSDFPMSRLLEGDVGSGKTVVAAIAALSVTSHRPPKQSFGKLQVAYMAPTEILANQIFNDFCEWFGGDNMTIGLLTSSGCKKFPSKVDGTATKISKKQLLEWTDNGEIQVLIGTHALISDRVSFENLGLVIVDEQHRFGKKQRAKLRHKPQAKKTQKTKVSSAPKTNKKGVADNDDILPHLLSMTATPIPRTLALTIYGDLDLTVLDDLPPNRKPVSTQLVAPRARDNMYEQVRAQLQQGRQAYIICSRVDESTKDSTAHLVSATVEAARLSSDIFPEYNIGVLYSKMNKQDKDTVMQKFVDGEYHILVSTSVIEVGVNVPNATCMIIENAERFGLAQLHQLRGRVMRSSYQPYCYLCTENQGKKTMDRLHIITTAANGFELAEADLQFRGTGEMLGNKQSGISDIAMEALSNLKLVEAARNEASQMITDQSLSTYPATDAKFTRLQKELYLE